MNIPEIVDTFYAKCFSLSCSVFATVVNKFFQLYLNLNFTTDIDLTFGKELQMTVFILSAPQR